MKTAATPHPRIELAPRTQVQCRQQQAEFVARGLASLGAVRQGSPTMTLDESMQALERRIAAARKRAARKTAP